MAGESGALFGEMVELKGESIEGELIAFFEGLFFVAEEDAPDFGRGVGHELLEDEFPSFVTESQLILGVEGRFA